MGSWCFLEGGNRAVPFFYSIGSSVVIACNESVTAVSVCSVCALNFVSPPLTTNHADAARTPPATPIAALLSITFVRVETDKFGRSCILARIRRV